MIAIVVLLVASSVLLVVQRQLRLPPVPGAEAALQCIEHGQRACARRVYETNFPLKNLDGPPQGVMPVVVSCLGKRNDLSR